VTTRINLQEAKELLPRLLDRPLVGGPIVVEDQGRPYLVMLVLFHTTNLEFSTPCRAEN
jgi:hypothetical protein